MPTLASRSRRASDERGASAVEYALVLAGIAALIVLAVYAFGAVTGEMFTNSCQTIKTQTQSTASVNCS